MTQIEQLQEKLAQNETESDAIRKEISELVARKNSKYHLERNNVDFPKVDLVARELRKALKLTDIASFEVRESGSYANKGLFLSKSYDWEIVTDNSGCLILTIKS